MRVLPCLAFPLLLACATSGGPPPQSVTPNANGSNSRAQVEAVLNQPSTTPDAWKAIPDATYALRQIAGDPTMPPQQRAKATEALGTVDGPEVATALQTLASDANELPAVRSAAIVAMAVRGGPASAQGLSGYLADANAEVRLSAAHALGIAGGEPAKNALQARLDAETDPKVRDEIQKSLAKMTN
ncbi:MAG: HEAT repeat domain-containing protein [Deltaproteobacteria bacterium]|nr:HEAT repeat domain-containing protein [Deltaproteobacteria bacterium]